MSVNSVEQASYLIRSKIRKLFVLESISLSVLPITSYSVELRNALSMLSALVDRISSFDGISYTTFPFLGLSKQCEEMFFPPALNSYMFPLLKANVIDFVF